MEDPIVNRVANSSLLTIDPEDYYDTHERIEFDLAAGFSEEGILREKSFRAFLSGYDWEKFRDKAVYITAPSDSIVPQWAWLLVSSYLENVAWYHLAGDRDSLELVLYSKGLEKLDPTSYQDQKIIIKGCSRYEVPLFAFTELTRRLKPYAQSIMYGEACSTVPVYKRKKEGSE